MKELSVSPLFKNLHSNEKFRVFATEVFRSEKSTETSNYSTEVSVETHETFESVSRLFSKAKTFEKKPKLS
jgi:hypothetical protein